MGFSLWERVSKRLDRLADLVEHTAKVAFIESNIKHLGVTQTLNVPMMFLVGFIPEHYLKLLLGSLTGVMAALYIFNRL